MNRARIAVAAVLGFICVTTAAALAADGPWVKLGTRTVNFRDTKDTIPVGRSEGKFTHVRFMVEDGDLLMERIKITFGNGDTFEPTTKLEFREGSRSREIELPAKVAGRVITKVDFYYRSAHRRETATIVLFGREK